MIVQKEFLNKIKDLGLNSYEAKLWTALLSRGTSTAGELSDIANVPRSRSYDVLESLEKKGFIIMKIGKPIKYVAIKPSEVIERVKKNIEEETKKTVEVINSIKETKVLDELNNLYKKGIELVDPVEITSSIKGRTNIYNHMETMIRGAEKSIVIMTTAKGLINKAEFLGKALENAKKRGVEIKIAAPLSKETNEAVKSLSEFADLKNSNENARFCVVDGKEVIFMLTGDETNANYDSGVWVNTKIFAEMLEKFFENAWSKMKAVDSFMKAA